jgi:hypothetical protein
MSAALLFLKQARWGCIAIAKVQRTGLVLLGAIICRCHIIAHVASVFSQLSRYSSRTHHSALCTASSCCCHIIVHVASLFSQPSTLPAGLITVHKTLASRYHPSWPCAVRCAPVLPETGQVGLHCCGMCMTHWSLFSGVVLCCCHIICVCRLAIKPAKHNIQQGSSQCTRHWRTAAT